MKPRAWVVDASFCGALLLPDEHSSSALALVSAARNGAIDLVTTSLWRHEIANMLVSAVRSRRISRGQLPGAWVLLEALPIRIHRDEPTGAETTHLAVEAALTAYDAGYLGLALALKAGLASEDKDLRKAARHRHVPLWDER